MFKGRSWRDFVMGGKDTPTLTLALSLRGRGRNARVSDHPAACGGPLLKGGGEKPFSFPFSYFLALPYLSTF
jgi:hypothetical protein